MGQVFIRRTTAGLLLLIAGLIILCVALLAMVLNPNWNNSTEHYISESTPSSTTTDKLEDIRTEPWEKNYRIPKETLPEHYDLYLHPDLEKGTYSGHVTTLIKVSGKLNYLVTHMKGLDIKETMLINADGNKTIEIKEAFEYKPNEFWVVKPKMMLSPGKYLLKLKFEGSLDGKIVGFYMSVYTTKAGEKRPIATSKFQPTFARQAFPCFDEPSFKSTFTTTLVRPSEKYIALSNMPLKSEKVDAPRQGLTEAIFEKSVPMVTYLACFIVCDFESVETLTQDNKKFTVYATKDQINRAEYAKDIGVHILNYYENYFEVKYPLPKQDMIAIPDFVSGAMEHWGLITYREVNLLYDEKSSSSYNKLRVASVISHELAHMWFGNLVTLKWWDDLWLNEGFASYIEYKGVANYEKDWDMEEQFLTSDLHYVMELDSLLSSHPIVQVVNHPDEITEIFDAISYSKGASVLRMLEDFMGPEDFRIGVRNFLRKFKFKNAVTLDLWYEFTNTSSSKLDIEGIMDTWTRQMGYPVINVMTSKNDPNKYILTQERFLSDPGSNSIDDSPFHYKWDVPISFITDTNSRQLKWLKKDMSSLEISKPTTASWIKLNVGQYGYYRVNYDLKTWDQLSTLLNTNHKALSAPDRANLLDDAFKLADADVLPYKVVFDLTNYLTKEQHYIPWTTVADQLSVYGHLLRKTKVYPYLRKYILKLIGDHVRRLGWEDNGTHLERRNRINLLSLACSNGEETCLSGAYTRFKSLINDPTTVIAPNLRSLVYKYGIKKAGYAEWELLLQRYQNELNAQEKAKIMYGLTNIEQDWIIYRFLDLAKNESIIRSQDYFKTLTYLAGNPAGTHIVWNFIKENWNYLVDRFTLNDRYLGRTVKSVGTKFTSNYELNDLKQFFTDNPEAGAGKRARVQAVEAVETNIKWIQKHQETIYIWLVKKLEL